MAETADIAEILRDYVPRTEYEAALEAIDATSRDRDEFRAAAEKHTGRLSELEKKLRGRAYRDKYRELAKGKVKDEFADDVYDLLKIEEDSDEPDAKAMVKALESFLEKKAVYKASPTADRPRTIERGEGSARGRSTAPGEPEFRVTSKQRNDAVWMRDNQKQFNEASKAGLLVFDED